MLTMTATPQLALTQAVDIDEEPHFSDCICPPTFPSSHVVIFPFFSFFFAFSFITYIDPN